MGQMVVVGVFTGSLPAVPSLPAVADGQHQAQ
jgi:hypothetical protein